MTLNRDLSSIFRISNLDHDYDSRREDRIGSRSLIVILNRDLSSVSFFSIFDYDYDRVDAHSQVAVDGHPKRVERISGLVPPPLLADIFVEKRGIVFPHRAEDIKDRCGPIHGFGGVGSE